ncbi:MAG: transporter related protein [Candidatus Nomurabacteria bacterium]|nr:transporter related protein [Candidatus Nomurabacteria bacterium]
MNNKIFIKKLLQFFRPFWKHLAVIVGILIITQLLGTLSPYLFGLSVDAVIHKNVHLTFVYLFIAFCISFTSSQLLWWFKESYELKFLDDHVNKALSVEALNTMFGFSIGQHINEHSGVKQSIVSKGQNSMTNLLYTILYTVLPAILQVLVTLTVLAIFDYRVALTALFFVILYITIATFVNQGFFPKIVEVRKKNQAKSKTESELYRNSTLVISEAQETATIKDFSSFSQEVADFSTSTWLGYLRPYYTTKSLITIGQYTTLAVGVYLILIGQHTTGMFITLFSWTGTIFNNLQQITNYQRSILLQVAEIRKFFDLLDIKPDINPNENGMVIENLQGKIEFKDVSFAYPYRKSTKEDREEIEGPDKQEDNTVSHISFTIPAGAKIGFVGVSGSGKSTIVNLMRRFYDPTEGEILIDDVNLKDMNLHWLRSRIGNVEQKIDLFDRSIKDNILFGLPSGAEVPDEKVQKAVEDASLTEFIEKLKDHGLDTVIGEGGIKVSGGERQRIGIARALIKDPKILIFDEATSALDSINEKLIHDAINRSAQGRTTIIIAHRLSTVMDADIIFVVAKGKIVAQGTHKELEKNSEDYKELIKNQILMS